MADDGKTTRPGDGGYPFVPGGGEPVRKAARPDPLYVRDPLALVWRGIQSDTQVKRVHFIMTSGGQGVSSGEGDAFYNADTDRWLLSLVPYVGQGEHDFDPSAVHQLSLDFNFKDGTHESYAIGFSVRGRIAGAVTPQPSSGFPTTINELYDAVRTNLFLGQEIVRNPVTRPVRVWIGASSAADPLRMVSFHERDLWNVTGSAFACSLPVDPSVTLPTPTNFDFGQSTLFLEVAKLRVRRSAAVEELAVKPGTWTVIELAPHESVTFEFYAQPRPGTVSCPYEAPVIRKVCFPYALTSELIDERWKQLGMKLTGSWMRTIRFGEADETSVPIWSEAEGKIEAVTAAVGHPVDDQHLLSMACQGGIYPLIAN